MPSSTSATISINHLPPLSSAPPLSPAIRAPQPPCSPPTLRLRAPAPVRGMEVCSEAREEAKQPSLMRRAGSRPTWTSVSFTCCGEATKLTARAHKEASDPSEEDTRRSGVFLATRRHVNCEEGGFKKHGVMDSSVMVSQPK